MRTAPRLPGDEVRRLRPRRLCRRAVAELGGRTPLEVADMPVLRSLAAQAEVGRAAVIPAGMPPGSDVGNMSILGYDPAEYHTGRAPIEAAALGIELAPDQVAYRCNLVTVGDDGTMVDFAGGHPATEEPPTVIAALDAALGGATRRRRSFHPGVQYRHIMVAPGRLGRRRVHAAARPDRQAGRAGPRARRPPSSSS